VCRPETEDCIDGRCYCKIGGNAVPPLITPDGRLAKVNAIQRCPPVPSTTLAPQNSTSIPLINTSIPMVQQFLHLYYSRICFTDFVLPHQIIK
jgi:hypothetical protein